MPLNLVCELAATPPVRPPVTSGADQAYVVLAGIILPLVPCIGSNSNGLPLQAFKSATVILALGLIVTV